MAVPRPSGCGWEAVATMKELTDPETLRGRDDVEFVDESTEEHQDHFERYEPIAGMAIAGVTDENGELLLLQREDAPIPVLPYGWTEPGDDWVTTAREAVADSTDAEVAIEGVRRVRQHTYRSASGAETTGYDVVFAARLEGERDVSEAGGLSCREEWKVAWHDTTSLDLPDDPDNDVLNDIRLFVG